MRFVRLTLQIAALASIFRLGSVIVEGLHLPVPGNVLGMLILFALLCCGLVKETWIAEGAGLLTRHLSFFFVPIVVGLMDWTGPLIESGPRLLVVLVGSSLAGLFVTGRVVQLLGRKPSQLARAPRQAEAKS
jgi:holin-like protein